jgi:hypothetical protein
MLEKMMKEKIIQNKIVINILLFLALLVAVVFLVILPLIRNIKKQAYGIQQKKIDNEISQKKLSNLPEMENRHAVFSDPKNNLDLIITSDQEVDFIKKMESLADETGNKIDMKIDDSQLTDKKDKKDKKDKEDIKSKLPYDNFIIIQVSLEGDYSGLLKFLNKLENLDKFVNVTAINLNKAEKEKVRTDPYVATDNSESEIAKEEILRSVLEVIVYIKK